MSAITVKFRGQRPRRDLVLEAIRAAFPGDGDPTKVELETLKEFVAQHANYETRLSYEIGEIPVRAYLSRRTWSNYINFEGRYSDPYLDSIVALGALPEFSKMQTHQWNDERVDGWIDTGNPAVTYDLAQSLPQGFITEDRALKLVRSNGGVLPFIPKSIQSDDLLREAVRSNPLILVLKDYRSFFPKRMLAELVHIGCCKAPELACTLKEKWLNYSAEEQETMLHEHPISVIEGFAPKLPVEAIKTAIERHAELTAALPKGTLRAGFGQGGGLVEVLNTLLERIYGFTRDSDIARVKSTLSLVWPDEIAWRYPGWNEVAKHAAIHAPYSVFSLPSKLRRPLVTTVLDHNPDLAEHFQSDLRDLSTARTFVGDDPRRLELIYDRSVFNTLAAEFGPKVVVEESPSM